MLPEQLVFLGVFLNIIGGVGYLRDTIKGTIQPNRASYSLWALSSFIVFAAQVNQGVGLTSLLTFTLGFFPVLIVAATFIHKKSVWKLTSIDYICAAFSLLGMLLWILTQTGNLAILFNILADGLAAIPTLLKSYKAPETENRLAYFLSGVSGLLTLLTIKNWDFAAYSYPLYILVVNFLIYLVLHIRNRK